MRIVIRKILFTLLVFFINFISIIPIIAGNFHIPNPPDKIYPIQDYAKVLSKKQIQNLNKNIISYSKKTSTEILVSIIKNTNQNDPNFIAQKWGEKWKIGKSKKNNGIVILLSIEEKKISIQNGYGIEPYITDILSNKIIHKIKPFLEKKMYYNSIDFCTKEIYKTLKNNFKKEKEKYYKKNFSFIITMIFIVIIFIIMFILPRTYTRHEDLLFNIFIITNFLKSNNNNNINDDDFFEGFGHGGHFGGGGSDESW
ncbi:TPM domain-containing protein [Blattabacterium cuenoti]|uniref:TPM domain-containing protein n=1 Tax=Blattabacterium cuenoti TaxID=1653831 RepID=UPI00163BD7DE|nr:TPM domain-containing protein [Blattabacterium cuenoti]